MLQWKDGVQGERKEHDDKTNSTLAMEAKMSRAKNHEILRLRSDLQQAVQEKGVRIIILGPRTLHALLLSCLCVTVAGCSL